MGMDTPQKPPDDPSEPPATGAEALIRIAESMRKVADDIQPTVEAATKLSRRTRNILIVNLILIAGLIANAVRTESALDIANRTQITAQTVCEGTNELRKAELDLWLPLLLRPPDPAKPPPTEAEKRQVEQFKASLLENFAPQDCTPD